MGFYFANTAAQVSEAGIQADVLLPPDAWSSSATAQLAGTWLESCGGTDASAVGGVLACKSSLQHLPLPPSYHLSELRRGAKLTALLTVLALWQYPGNGNRTLQDESPEINQLEPTGEERVS